MPLEELEKKLYGKDFERWQREERKEEKIESRFQPWKGEILEKTISQPEQKRPSWNWRKFFLIFFSILVLISIGAGLYFWYVYFPQNKVETTFYGPKEVRAGEIVTYIFRYKNNTKTVLKNAEVILRYSQGILVLNSNNQNANFIRKSLGNIGVGSEMEESFSVLFFGEPPVTRRLEVALSYTPANLPSSRLENKEILDVTISALTLNVDLFLPKQVLSSEPFNFTVNYQNNSNFVFSEARLIVDWPENFVFLGADRKPSEGDNIWNLGKIGAFTNGKIEIKGVISGAVSEHYEFKARIGLWHDNHFLSFKETRGLLTIIGLPLVLKSSVNDKFDYIAKPGEILIFRIIYKNTGQIGLKDAILRAELTGTMFDFRTVEVEGGYFSSQENSIIWNAGSWPDLSVLEPNEEGEVTFRVQVKKDYPIKSSVDKNFVLKVKSTIISPTVPAYLGVNLKQISATEEIVIKVRTQLLVSAKGYFRDPKGLIKNFGPLPPKVGEPTNYTIFWSVSNPSSEAENVTLRTTLSAGISWTGEVKILYGPSSLTYNDRTGEVIWNLGRVPAGTGIISPAYQAYFQVAAVPSINQVGQLFTIINETEFSGRDVFTGIDLSGQVAEIRSNLPDDPTITTEMGIVRE